MSVINDVISNILYLTYIWITDGRGTRLRAKVTRDGTRYTVNYIFSCAAGILGGKCRVIVTLYLPKCALIIYFQELKLRKNYTYY